MEQSPVNAFELIVRRSVYSSELSEQPGTTAHPFDVRAIDSDVARVARTLFDDGHYSQATFEAFKLIDRIVSTSSSIGETGFKLMMQAFDPKSGPLKLNSLSTQSEIDEQDGYRYIFAGVMRAIRNPRGHDEVRESPDECLDYLSLASLLVRRLRQSGYP